MEVKSLARLCAESWDDDRAECSPALMDPQSSREKRKTPKKLTFSLLGKHIL